MDALKKTTLIAILAAIPNPTPAKCVDPLNTCEKNLLKVSIKWEERAKTQRARARNCEEKLKTRTSTAIKKLTTPEPQQPKQDHNLTVTITAAAVIIGFFLGALTP